MSVELSKKQKEIVDYNGGNLLIIAGAGSGKTRVLTESIKNKIGSLRKGEKILAITFSNKASDELQNRLYASLGKNITNEHVFIGTTHKFCLKLVESKGYLIGLPNRINICDSYDDRLEILYQACKEVPGFFNNHFKGNKTQNISELKGYLEKISELKRNLKNYDSLKDEELVSAFYEYDNILIQQDIIDFDDILKYAYQILIEAESVVRSYGIIYKHIFVDEAQDLNKAQYEVIKALSNNKIKVTFAGDPNQAIYGFNGSTSEFFEKEFYKDFSPKKIELNENYRSSKSIIKNANILENTLLLESVLPIEGEFEINSFHNEEAEANYVFEKIEYLVKNGHKDVENNKIDYEQCAVLARNRYVFKKLEEKLKENNIEYTLKTSSKRALSSESDLIIAFELGMRLINNPKDQLHLNKISDLLNLSVVPESFHKLRQTETLNDYWKEKFKVIDNAWQNLNNNIDDISFEESLNIIQTSLDKDQYGFEENDKLLIDNDINEWKNRWQIYGRKSLKGQRNLNNFLQAVSLGNTSTSVDKGVVLSTVHMSKGLEFDVVFIMGLNEGTFPDYRAVKKEEYGDDKQIKEERHNLFVAITRSKRLCYLCYPKIKSTKWGDFYQKPSRFILELKKDKNR